MCGYDLSVIIEKGSGGKVSKKELERLQRIKSMQGDLYNALFDLTKYYGYKLGYAYYLYRDLLTNAKQQQTGITFYKKMFNRINKCKERGYKIRWLLHQ